MKIERISPIITPEQLIELVKAGASTKTNELELAVAEAVRFFAMPPMIVDSSINPVDLSNLKAGQIIQSDD